ncbi:hypothetical protein [Wolbachia endosymbiont of Phyllotreta cruciferae]|uniref:hypothetical protein n=1 Tax=Wolbachia endosymbiont of Phyllotreta cruciferae TaxID=2886377 RepID=UPI0020A1F67F|nr:hypothetical protein [Wolbachia endosymbiont of Phyllotreta cruciferae]
MPLRAMQQTFIFVGNSKILTLARIFKKVLKVFWRTISNKRLILPKILVPKFTPEKFSNNEKEHFLPIARGLSEFIVCSICLLNDEIWY